MSEKKEKGPEGSYTELSVQDAAWRVIREAGGHPSPLVGEPLLLRQDALYRELCVVIGAERILRGRMMREARRELPEKAKRKIKKLKRELWVAEKMTDAVRGMMQYWKERAQEEIENTGRVLDERDALVEANRKLIDDLVEDGVSPAIEIRFHRAKS